MRDEGKLIFGEIDSAANKNEANVSKSFWTFGDALIHLYFHTKSCSVPNAYDIILLFLVIFFVF